MNGLPSTDMLETIKQIVKELHIQSREAMTDEELLAALAFFRSQRVRRRLPTYHEMATYQLLLAFRKFRDSVPIETGESPFEYRK
jgi:hypothetical protein